MTSHRTRSRLAVALAATLLLGLLASAPANADASAVTRTPWQMHIDPTPYGYLGFTLPSLGHESTYAFADVPAEDAGSWQPAPDGDVIGFDGRVSGYGGGSASRLWGCGNLVDYTYFQTFVTIPANEDVTTFSVTFNGIDDGARISVYNTDSPEGLIVEGSYVYLGGTGTTNLAEHLVTGVNRVVITQVDNCAVGNNLSEARVVVNGTTIVPPPANTAPTVAVTGVVDGTVYEIGAVPAAGCSADDAEEELSNPDPSLSAITGPKSAAGLGQQTATCSVTDAGGLTATASATYSIDDTVDPTLSGAPTTAPNEAGWYSGPVTIAWTAADSGSGVDPATTPGDSLLSDDGVGQTATASVSDLNGNGVTATSAPAVNIDQTAPTLAFLGGSAYGLLDTVSISCSADDDLSGLASDDCPSASGPAWSFGPGVHGLSATATDNAGNEAGASTSFEVTATADSLCALVHAFTDHKGTQTSLCAHLTNAARSRSKGKVGPAAAQLDAFRKEASARSGKQLTPAQVATLIGWVNTL